MVVPRNFCFTTFSQRTSLQLWANNQIPFKWIALSVCIGLSRAFMPFVCFCRLLPQMRNLEMFLDGWNVLSATLNQIFLAHSVLVSLIGLAMNIIVLFRMRKLSRRNSEQVCFLWICSLQNRLIPQMAFDLRLRTLIAPNHLCGGSCEIVSGRPDLPPNNPSIRTAKIVTKCLS